MCGIIGFLELHPLSVDAEAVLKMMVGRLRHRGPDDAGIWVDEQVGVALGHTRLSILDLSSAGHQPMVSPSGRYVITYNGEIYNHLELRAQLGSHAWRGHSDTETLLAAIEAWGIEKTLQAAAGMFAFGLWDCVERRLILARDRIGEKPLYYGRCGTTFLFGSELKALTAHPAWEGRIDRAALASFMRYAYVPIPHSIYTGIRKLVPGTYLTVTGSDQSDSFPEPRPYWSALDVARQPEQVVIDEQEAADELERLLRQAIKGQMVADVPLGAFLSGGIDSSSVVALMQAQSSRPIRTFSIGFEEGEYDEAQYARAVARHLGTEHTEFYVTPVDALQVIPRLPDIYDEPFGDSSAIPMHLVAELARRHVTVALSGDGGDELFGGYNRHFWARSIWQKVGFLPAAIRRGLGIALTRVSPQEWDRWGNWLAPLLPRTLRIPTVGDKLHKLAEVLPAIDQADMYRRLVSQHRSPESLVIGGSEPSIWADEQGRRLERADFSERMMFHDLVGYLTDDILVKVDRAAMAVSLETRIPLLDHRVVAFAWQLPLRFKVRNDQGKWLLRQVLYRHVPRELIERPKMGFGVPLDRWLRGELRDWAEGLLNERRIRQEGYFDPGPIRKKWEEHLSGRRNWQYWLWNVLVFQAWNQRRL